MFLHVYKSICIQIYLYIYRERERAIERARERGGAVPLGPYTCLRLSARCRPSADESSYFTIVPRYYLLKLHFVKKVKEDKDDFTDETCFLAYVALETRVTYEGWSALVHSQRTQCTRLLISEGRISFAAKRAVAGVVPQRQKQVLRRKVKRFRGGLVFKAHRLVYHSTLGWRVIKNKKKARLQEHTALQGYLAHKKKPPNRILQKAYA